MLEDMADTGSVIEEKDSDSAKKIASTIEVLMELGRQKGFEVEAGKDCVLSLGLIFGQKESH